MSYVKEHMKQRAIGWLMLVFALGFSVQQGLRAAAPGGSGGPEAPQGESGGADGRIFNSDLAKKQAQHGFGLMWERAQKNQAAAVVVGLVAVAGAGYAIYASAITALWGIGGFAGGVAVEAVQDEAEKELKDSNPTALAFGKGLFRGFVLGTGCSVAHALGGKWAALALGAGYVGHSVSVSPSGMKLISNFDKSKNKDVAEALGLAAGFGAGLLLSKIVRRGCA